MDLQIISLEDKAYRYFLGNIITYDGFSSLIISFDLFLLMSLNIPFSLVYTIQSFGHRNTISMIPWVLTLYCANATEWLKRSHQIPGNYTPENRSQEWSEPSTPIFHAYCK